MREATRIPNAGRAGERRASHERPFGGATLPVKGRDALTPSRIALVMTLVAALFPSGASAFEGRYLAGSKSYSQEIEIKKSGDGSYNVEASVATRACAGEFNGAGPVTGDILRATAELEKDRCTLILRRTKTGVSVEEENCLPFHGAACDFTGDYRKR
jgi:hypothetical protein